MRIAPMGELLKRCEKLVTDNSPAILTAVGVVGTLTTAYLTGRATLKASQVLHEEVYTASPQYNETISNKEIVSAVWKLYVPAAGTAALTIAAIIGANRIGTRRAAALAAAYSVSQRAFDEYREKIVEKLGANKEEQARAEIAKERLNKNPPNSTIIIGEGPTRCHEAFTGRYFYSDMQTIRRAENIINQRVLTDSYASLADLYELLDLPQTSESHEVGWTLDRLLKIEFSSIIHGDYAYISMEYSVSPIRNFDRLK